MGQSDDNSSDSAPIPLCVPEIRGNEWEYIKECLDTNWVSSAGAYVDQFEEAMAEYVGTNHGIATVNGTAALHTALRTEDIGQGDEVLVSTLTFIAPVNAIRYTGADPVFVDAEPDYLQMDAGRIVEFVEETCEHRDGAVINPRTGGEIRAIMPVHILGHPVDMEPLMDVANRYDLTVIEDATESLGARYRDRPVGSMGDMAAFSFNGNKLLTTGGGGMLVTDCESTAQRARYLTTQAKDDPVEYVHEEVGYNYRLTNIQAAMGCAQLEQISDYASAKRRIADRYRQALSDVPGIRPMAEAPWAESVYWLYTVGVDPESFGRDRKALESYLADRDIQTRPLWQPIHRSPAYEGVGTSLGGDVADATKATSLSLPCSVGLTSSKQDRVIAAIRSAAAN